MKARVLVVSLVAGSIAMAGVANAQYTHTWAASSGSFPNADCFWGLATSNPAQASLSGGALRIATNALTDYHYYTESGHQLAIPLAWVIEARMRLVSDTGDGLSSTCASIGFAVAPQLENILSIGAGTIYLWSGAFTIGSQAFLDTQNAFHTYRIAVTDSGTVYVYYDNALKLTGNVFFDPAFESTTYLWWGDGSSHASGTSLWEHMTHNGNAYDACPTPIERKSWGRIKNAYR